MLIGGMEFVERTSTLGAFERTWVGRLGPVQAKIDARREPLALGGHAVFARVFVLGAGDYGALDVGGFAARSLDEMGELLGAVLVPLRVAASTCETCGGDGELREGVGIVSRRICGGCHGTGRVLCEHCVEESHALVVADDDFGGGLCPQHLAVHLADHIAEIHQQRRREPAGAAA